MSGESNDRGDFKREIIVGGFTILAAAIGSMVAWYNPFATPIPPTTHARTSSEAEPPLVVLRTAELPNREFAVTTVSQSRVVAPELPSLFDLRMNFQLFQNTVTHGDLIDALQVQLVDQLKGSTVTWKGYVRSSKYIESGGEPPMVVVSICESKDKLTQSMFYTSAVFHCRPPSQQLINLRPGQCVTLSGRLISHSKLGTIILGGVLIAVE